MKIISLQVIQQTRKSLASRVHLVFASNYLLMLLDFHRLPLLLCEHGHSNEDVLMNC